MAYKMKVKRTFDGLEGFKRAGDIVEVGSKNRAESLFKAGYADYVGQQGQDDSGEIQPTPVELTEAAKTHAELDSLVKEYKLDNIPTKEEGAKLDERKEAIKVAL